MRGRRRPPSLRYLAWLTWFELPLEMLGSTLGLLHRNTLFIMPFYTVGELALLALAYGSTLRSAAFSRAMWWLAAGFTAYALLDSLLAANLTSWFRPGQQVARSLLILSMVGLCFRKLLRKLQVPHLGRGPLCRVSVGLALYFRGYLQIALFSNYMLRHYSMPFNRPSWPVYFGLTGAAPLLCRALARGARRGAPAWPAAAG